jgi:menaquinone-9 beta-reductase
MNAPHVVVVGAGPAGSSAALAALEAGARVTVLDRADFPRGKVCGCCLSDAGVAALRRIGAESALGGAAPLRALRLCAGGVEAVVQRASGVVIGREELDAAILGLAGRRGASVRTGAPASVGVDGRVMLDGDELHADAVVVADGIAGTSLDRHPAFAWRVAPANRIGFGAQLPAGVVRASAGEVSMHVARGGYVGVVELPCGSVDVAAAACPRALRASGGPAACAAAWLGDAVRDADALRAARWRGTPPLTRRRTAVAAPGIVVAGDAAGYVEPFTGEGMGWALETGAAAGAFAAAMARGEAGWNAWPAMHAGIVGGARRRCRAIALALRSPMAAAGAAVVARTMPALFASVACRVGQRSSGRAALAAGGIR